MSGLRIQGKFNNEDMQKEVLLHAACSYMDIVGEVHILNFLILGVLLYEIFSIYISLRRHFEP
jgi:hypothetical protein